ncbi:MAG: Hpt domain-containing protein, partial [Parvibaculum sp.]
MKPQVRVATVKAAGTPMNFRAGEVPVPAARPLDLVHLAKYTLGNRALEIELLGLFRAQAGIYIERIESAVTAIDWKNATHSLKGSAKGLGAWPLAA